MPQFDIFPSDPALASDPATLWGEPVVVFAAMLYPDDKEKADDFIAAVLVGTRLDQVESNDGLTPFATDIITIFARKRSIDDILSKIEMPKMNGILAGKILEDLMWMARNVQSGPSLNKAIYANTKNGHKRSTLHEIWRRYRCVAPYWVSWMAFIRVAEDLNNFMFFAETREYFIKFVNLAEAVRGWCANMDSEGGCSFPANEMWKSPVSPHIDLDFDVPDKYFTRPNSELLSKLESYRAPKRDFRD
jgi:hypothetical protein